VEQLIALSRKCCATYVVPARFPGSIRQADLGKRHKSSDTQWEENAGNTGKMELEKTWWKVQDRYAFRAQIGEPMVRSGPASPNKSRTQGEICECRQAECGNATPQGEIFGDMESPTRVSSTEC
jgi:hypothetical protein